MSYTCSPHRLCESPSVLCFAEVGWHFIRHTKEIHVGKLHPFLPFNPQLLPMSAKHLETWVHGKLLERTAMMWLQWHHRWWWIRSILLSPPSQQKDYRCAPPYLIDSMLGNGVLLHATSLASLSFFTEVNIPWNLSFHPFQVWSLWHEACLQCCEAITALLHFCNPKGHTAFIRTFYFPSAQNTVTSTLLLVWLV